MLSRRVTLQCCQAAMALVILSVLAPSRTIAESNFAAMKFTPSLHVSGTIRYHAKHRTGRIFAQKQSEFGLELDDVGRWKMHLVTTVPQLGVTSTEVISFDGRAIYDLILSSGRMTRGADGRMKVLPVDPAVATQRYSAVVSAGPYPVDHGSAVGCIWLAFCAWRYLDPIKTEEMFPNLLVSAARRDLAAWTCAMRRELVPNANGQSALLKSAQFIIDPSRLSHDSLDYPELDEPETDEALALLEQSVNRYAVLSQGTRVVAAFQVDDTANMDGVLIPVRFHAEFPPMQDQPDFAGALLQGEVAEYAPGHTEQSLLPEYSGSVRVEDRRLRFKTRSTWRESIEYNLGEDGWITDTNDGRIQRMSIAQKGVTRWSVSGLATPAGSLKPSLKRMIVVSLLVLLTLTAFAFIAKVRRSGR